MKLGVITDCFKKTHEEGIALARMCNSRLEDTERKIKMLQISADGEIEEKDFLENN